MKIGNFDLDKEILIIAEIGNNHEGSYTLAEEMIGVAAEAGAGAVKFQTIVPTKLVSATQKERVQQLTKFQLSYDEFEKLSRVAEQAGVLFLSTPFDLESAKFLNPLVPAFKIASGDNNFFPLLDVVARTGKPIIMSAGLTDLAQIKQSKAFIEQIWQTEHLTSELALLHCVVSYPTPPAEAHLLAIKTLHQLGVTVGYSDHTIGLEAAVLAVALGARIIEKHFTLDKHYSDFRDHQLAADPAELAQLVRRVNEAVELLGDPQKRIYDSEQTIGDKARRSIVARRELAEGTVVSWDDLAWVRPGGGLVPGSEQLVVGKRLTQSLQEGDMILLDYLVEV